MLKIATAMASILMMGSTAWGFAPCITSQNSEHAQRGRATLTEGSNGYGYYALTTDMYMGSDSAEITSLTEVSGVVEGILEYYDQLGYDPVSFIWITGNIYGIIMKYRYCEYYITVQMEASAWTISDCDSDGDMLNDAWELSYFNTLDEGAEGDFDDDNVSNLIEHLANTDPTTNADVPNQGNYYTYDQLGRLKTILRLD